jgi:hypothetical protein
LEIGFVSQTPRKQFEFVRSNGLPAASSATAGISFGKMRYPFAYIGFESPRGL